MRKIALVTLFICIIFLLGCQSTSQYEFAQPTDQISNLELIEVIDNNESVLTTLNVSSSLLTDIQALECKKYINDPSHSINGLAVKISYNDSSYEIISWESNVYCTTSKCKYGFEYFDKDSFNDLLQDYL